MTERQGERNESQNHQGTTFSTGREDSLSRVE
jgi:hypothetical protein